MPASQCMAVEVQDGIHRRYGVAAGGSSPASDATDCEAHPRSSPRCSQAPRRDLRHPAEAPAVVPVSTPSWDQAVLAPLSRSDVRYFTSAAIPRTSSATTSKPQRRRCHVGEFYLSIESVCRRPSGTKATPYAGAHRSFGFVPISAKVSADIGPIRAHRQGSLHAPPQYDRRTMKASRGI
jgi:hypothetical protein